VRFADDFVVLTHQQEESTAILTEIAAFLRENLKLNLNPDATVGAVAAGFEFLGIRLEGSRAMVTEEKLHQLANGMAEGLTLSGGAIHPDFFMQLKTIRSYYGRLIAEESLLHLDQRLEKTLIAFFLGEMRAKRFSTKQLRPAILHPLPFLSQEYRKNRNEAIRRIIKHTKTAFLKPPPETAQNKTIAAKIKRKKKEYQKKASRTRELLVNRPGLFIGKARGRIVVKQHGKNIQVIPLDPLQNITITGRGISLSSNMLYACAQKDIAIDFLRNNGKPYAKIMYSRGLSAKVGMAQLQAYQNGKGLVLARSFATGKIRNQINLIKYFEKYEKTADSHTHWQNLAKVLKEIKNYEIQSIEEGRSRLMAAEGRAASAYWKYVAYLLADKVEFPGRRQRHAGDSVNQALNYGYGILYGRMEEALARAGLHAAISYLHSPGDGSKPTLAFDLIEEFRTQAVDRPVIAMIRKAHIPQTKEGKLTDESRKKVAEAVLKRLSRYERFRSLDLTLQEIILSQGKLLANYLTGKAKRYRPYIRKW
jgi:CRISPR-associated endonuclease Cas1